MFSVGAIALGSCLGQPWRLYFPCLCGAEFVMCRLGTTSNFCPELSAG